VTLSLFDRVIDTLSTLPPRAITIQSALTGSGQSVQLIILASNFISLTFRSVIRHPGSEGSIISDRTRIVIGM
jgi:hypothetical protein